MSRFKKPAAAAAPAVDPELAARFAKTSPDPLPAIEAPATPTPAAELSRPVKETTYSIGYRIKPARMAQLERVLSRCPGVKSKQELLDNIINASLDRLDAQLSAQLPQY